MQSKAIFIPARYASTRLPAKPLCNIAGKTLIQRVYEQLIPLQKQMSIWVLTDDIRIEQHVRSWGGQVLMTDTKHQSGTERCAEALILLRKQGFMPDIVINVQGDEPLVQPEQIELISKLFDQKNINIATLIKKIADQETLFNPNRPKVVVDIQGKALFFSRQPIPYNQQQTQPNLWHLNHTYYKHIGMYAYRSETLLQIANLKMTALEQAESLEQLRWLEHGFDVYTGITNHESPAIDTPEDLAYINTLL